MRTLFLGILGILSVSIVLANAWLSGNTDVFLCFGGALVLAVGAWVGLRQLGRRVNRADEARYRGWSEEIAAACGGDASDAGTDNGWHCVSRRADGGRPSWEVRWRGLHGREGMDIDPRGAGLESSGAPAELARDGNIVHRVTVAAPCPGDGRIAWSIRRSPLAPDADPGEVFVLDGVGGLIEASEDDLRVYASAKEGRAAAATAARRQLEDLLARVGRSVRTGEVVFDAAIRSRTTDPGRLARCLAAPGARDRIHTLLHANAPFGSDLVIEGGELRWEALVTTRTRGAAVAPILQAVEALATDLARAANRG